MKISQQVLNGDLSGLSLEALNDQVKAIQLENDQHWTNCGVLYIDSDLPTPFSRAWDKLETELIKRECPRYNDSVQMQDMLNGYKGYHLDEVPMRYWDYLGFASLINGDGVRTPYEDWEIELCTEWNKHDANGDWIGGDNWDENYETNKHALYNLPYSLKLIEAVQDFCCTRRMDSVRAVNFACEWVVLKHRQLMV